jgi:hypothetical protein
MQRLTPEQVEILSGQNAKRWMDSQPAYFGCPYNSMLMDEFIATQVGREYVWSWENFEAAYLFLREAGVLQLRPAAPPSDAELAHQAEQAKQEQVRTDYQNRVAAQQEAETAQQRATEKNMPLHVLAGIVGVQNAQLRKAGLPQRTAASTIGSRERARITDDKLGVHARARQNVLTKFPAVARDSAEFNRLVVAEKALLGE